MLSLSTNQCLVILPFIDKTFNTKFSELKFYKMFDSQ